MSEKVKIVPNPEVEAPEVEVETEPKSKFPTKLVRNVIIGAVGVAVTGYVVSKIRSKDKEEEEAEAQEYPWVNVFVPADSEQSAAAE